MCAGFVVYGVCGVNFRASFHRMDLSPITLEGKFVRLEPLTPAHASDLVQYAAEPDLWRYTTTVVSTAADLDAYIATAVEWHRANSALAFATVDRATGRAIGSTRFANVDHVNRRVEIGWTWIAKPFQRTAVNTEAKFLMLQQAFECWECIRVELKTGHENIQSRTAIRRLGAVEEGTLRHHMILSGGRLRDTVYFSILRDEWPAVRAGLIDKLARRD
jgi:RimJ/RimL family protein N-acetyltransferase